MSEPARGLTTAEAAAIIGCDQSHVRALVRDKKIAGQAVTPRLYLLDPESVRAYADTPQTRGRPRAHRRAEPSVRSA